MLQLQNNTLNIIQRHPIVSNSISLLLRILSDNIGHERNCSLMMVLSNNCVRKQNWRTKWSDSKAITLNIIVRMYSKHQTLIPTYPLVILSTEIVEGRNCSLATVSSKHCVRKQCWWTKRINSKTFTFNIIQRRPTLSPTRPHLVFGPKQL